MSAGQPVQLPLGIKLRDEATFASYYPGPNATVLAATRAFASLQSAVPECCLFLWGTEGTGRTHLLQAACHALADEGGLAMYLPLDELAGLTGKRRCSISTTACVSRAVDCWWLLRLHPERWG